jgi:hypothetical protein
MATMRKRRYGRIHTQVLDLALRGFNLRRLSFSEKGDIGRHAEQGKEGEASR